MSYEADIRQIFDRAWYSTTNGLAPQFVHDIVARAKEADERLAAAERERTRINEIIGHDGPDTADQVEKEWHDYMMVVGECSKVYEHFSGLTKPNTAAEHVISFGDEREQKRIDAAVAEAEEVYKDRLEAAELRATRAEADGAAMREILVRVQRRDAVGGELETEIDAALASDHPGADLLARATAAEAVVEAARKLRKVDQDIRVGSAGMMNAREAALALDAALAEVAALERYQAAIASGLSHAEAQEEGWPATYDARVQEGK